MFKLNLIDEFIYKIFLPGYVFLSIACNPGINKETTDIATPDGPYIIILGIAQDGGYPHAACRKECCRKAWEDPSVKRLVTCLGLVDPLSGKRWLFEATPDFITQLHRLDELAPVDEKPGLAGIFLTHAHMGHYTGLMHLGHEAIGAKGVKVYAMPRMLGYLESGGPWSQLVLFENIDLQALHGDSSIQLGNNISVTPFLVPHRDEYSETIGFTITGPEKTILFIPDINKWDKWNGSIVEAVKNCDIAFLDGTFFDENELPGRNMNDIPHPFIKESLLLFKSLPEKEKAKVYFIHLNHSNPVMEAGTEAYKEIINAGFGIADEDRIIEL